MGLVVMVLDGRPIVSLRLRITQDHVGVQGLDYAVCHKLAGKYKPLPQPVPIGLHDQGIGRREECEPPDPHFASHRLPVEGRTSRPGLGIACYLKKRADCAHRGGESSPPSVEHNSNYNQCFRWNCHRL